MLSYSEQKKKSLECLEHKLDAGIYPNDGKVKAITCLFRKYRAHITVINFILLHLFSICTSITSLQSLYPYCQKEVLHLLFFLL